MTEIQARYKREGLALGITVQEWEEANGFAPFTVYPDAANAIAPWDEGYFMYRNAETQPRVSEYASTRVRLLHAVG